jgi:CubicO group peptidase (beta-lactamase class C family)
MREHVWRPAGMLDTTLSATEVISRGNYATGFDPATGTVYDPRDFDLPALGPAGTALSTPSDMVRWAEVLMNDGAGVIAPASAQAMQLPQVSLDRVPWAHYGYGILVWDYADATDPTRRVRVLGHDGKVPGGSALLYWVPERRMAVSVMATTITPLLSSAHCALAALGGVVPIREEVPLAPRADWENFAGTYTMQEFPPPLVDWDDFALWNYTLSLTAAEGCARRISRPAWIGSENLSLRSRSISPCG